MSETSGRTPVPSVVTIGVFDGVHRGHARLVETAVALAATEGLRPVAITFEPHPMNVVRGLEVPMLATLPRRSTLLHDGGIAHVHICDFTPERAAQDPEVFIDEVLVSTLGARIVVVGEGFRFGRRAAGSAQTLRDAGLVVHEVPQVVLNGDRVSSTRIRGLVTEGDVVQAAELLGRPHRLEGVVVHGHARGRDIGYPTANLAVADRLLIPADGVYAGWLARGEVNHGFDGAELLPAAISIGTNPTFEDVLERRVEAYVLDRTDLDLYNEYVALDFVTRIRGMEKFDGLPDLLAAMARDVETARRVLANG